MKNSITPKERILETAYKLFYVQGYNVTGINQILEESKVAKASLYQHFGSKEDLGIAYIKKVREDWFKSFESHLARKDDPKQKILSVFDFLEANMKLNDYRGCRFLNLLADIDTASKGMQTEILAHKTKLRNLFKTLVKHYTKDEVKLTMPNPHDVIYLLFEAAITESKVYRDVWPIQIAKKTATSIITTTN